MTDQRPLVSILMPVYNAIPYLKQAIESVLNETYDNFELLICNDASTDGSSVLLQEFAAKDSRIRLWENKVNLGKVAKVYQFLAGHAVGTYLLTSDADDIAIPSRLETLVKYGQLMPETSIVYGRVLVVDSVCQNLLGIYGKSFSPYQLFSGNYIPDGAALIRKNVFDAIGGYNQEIIWAEDYELRLRLVLRAPAFYVPEIVYLYRMHNSNWTASKHNPKEEDSFKLALLNSIKTTETQYSQGVLMSYRMAFSSLNNSNQVGSEYSFALFKFFKECSLVFHSLVSAICPHSDLDNTWDRVLLRDQCLFLGISQDTSTSLGKLLLSKYKISSFFPVKEDQHVIPSSNLLSGSITGYVSDFSRKDVMYTMHPVYRMGCVSHSSGDLVYYKTTDIMEISVVFSYLLEKKATLVVQDLAVAISWIVWYALSVCPNVTVGHRVFRESLVYVNNKLDILSFLELPKINLVVAKLIVEQLEYQTIKHKNVDYFVLCWQKTFESVSILLEVDPDFFWMPV